MIAVLLIALALLGTVRSTTAQQPAQRASVVYGVVRGMTKQPIAGAEVSVRTIAGTAMTDSLGRFRIVVPDTIRRVVVQVRRPGYAPVAVVVAESEIAVPLRIELVPRPLHLPEISVEAAAIKPARYAGTVKYDDVLRRRRTNLGTFIDREMIDRAPAVHTLELLRGIPGIRVNVGPGAEPSLSSIAFARCSGPDAKVSVWIDGRKLTPPRPWADREYDLPPSSKVAEMLTRISPGDIEMIEIFRGVAQMPAEFIDDSCAAIAIWTR